MVPRGPTIRKRLSPNSTTTVAAYIITGIHIYAWNTQDRRWRWNEAKEDEEAAAEEEEPTAAEEEEEERPRG